MHELSELELVLDQLTNKTSLKAVSPAAGGPCQTWQSMRPSVVALIQILETIGAVVPQAKLAAEALDAIETLLDELCPPATAAGADQLSARLASALRPKAAPSESPCDVWQRVRPIVDEAITVLRALSGQIPILGRVADVLSSLEQVANALCGVPASLPAPAPAAARRGTHPADAARTSRGGYKVVTRHGKPARTHIKYPSPVGLRPHAGGPFTVAQLCKQYNFPQGVPTNRAATIGILELGGGYQDSDLQQFSSLNGISPAIQANAVSVDGGTNSPGGEADGEVLLDIQVAGAAYFYCTGALPTINVYFAPNADSSFASVIQRAISDGCDVLSISWGKDEDAWDPTVAQQIEDLAAEAAAAGCVLFAASGDNSSDDGAASANVDLPSGCPHIIGCGGTTKVPGAEVVWGDGTANGRGTGGGFSALFPRPSWQVISNPDPAWPNTRMVPDVAADADPDTGYEIVINGQQTPIGGTSAVAPLYSGLFAALAAGKGAKLTQVAQTLWANPGAFVDIIKGSNGSYFARKGPDPCTGLGVPDGAKIQALPL
jgi:kumamolisin